MQQRGDVDLVGAVLRDERRHQPVLAVQPHGADAGLGLEDALGVERPRERQQAHAALGRLDARVDLLRGPVQRLEQCRVGLALADRVGADRPLERAAGGDAGGAVAGGAVPGVRGSGGEAGGSPLVGARRPVSPVRALRRGHPLSSLSAGPRRCRAAGRRQYTGCPADRGPAALTIAAGLTRLRAP